MIHSRFGRIIVSASERQSGEMQGRTRCNQAAPSAANAPCLGLQLLTMRSHAVAKYGAKASEKVGKAMHERKRGALKSGSGKKVTSRKQAIAIGLSEARKAGGKVPSKKSAAKKATAKKSGAKRTPAKKSTA